MSDVDRLNRMITNLYTAVFERGTSVKRNRPVRLISNVNERVGLIETVPEFTLNVPKARYYEDAVITGDYDQTDGFPCVVSTNYLTYTLNVFDDPAVQGFLVARVKMTYAATAAPQGFPVFFEIGHYNDDDRLVCFYDNATDHFGIIRDDTTGLNEIPGVGHADNADLTLLWAWTATQLGIAINGSAITWFANTAVPATADDFFSLGGSGPDTAPQASSGAVFHWALLGNGTPTDEDSAAFHALGNDDPTWADLPEDTFADLDPCFLWPGVDETHTPTAVYGESLYE